jgi:hypothetical protein
MMIFPLLSSNSSYFSVETQCMFFVINLKLCDHDHDIFSTESIYIPHFASLIIAFSIWLVAILLKVALSTENQINQYHRRGAINKKTKHR